MSYPAKALGWLFMKPVGQGAWNQTWAATAPHDKVKSGTFYWPTGITGKDSKLALDDEVSEKLWEWTEKELQNV